MGTIRTEREALSSRTPRRSRPAARSILSCLLHSHLTPCNQQFIAESNSFQVPFVTIQNATMTSRELTQPTGPKEPKKLREIKVTQEEFQYRFPAVLCKIPGPKAIEFVAVEESDDWKTYKEKNKAYGLQEAEVSFFVLCTCMCCPWKPCRFRSPPFCSSTSIPKARIRRR